MFSKGKTASSSQFKSTRNKPVTCRCTSCRRETKQVRYELKRRVRCLNCGGNVVEAKYA